MQNQDDTELLQCPYDPVHRILKTRMQVHLGRCRRNHTNVPKATCPFNVTHVLNKPELNWHVSTCSDRAAFENFKYRDEPTIRPTPMPPQFETESSENWDDVPDVPTYNPLAYSTTAPVLRLLQGAPPAAKKQFREKERLRLLGLEK